METKEELLVVKGFSIGFSSGDAWTDAVDNVSFAVKRNECVGLLGGSGCGKSLLAKAIVGLLPRGGGIVRRGRIVFKGTDILDLPLSRFYDIRGKEIGAVFQDSTDALNPVKRIGRQVSEALRIHYPRMKKEEVDEYCVSILRRVGFSEPDRLAVSFPHMLSEGMRKRIMIAMAMILRPDLLIADEPTAALDVTIRVQIADLLESLKREFRTSILLLTRHPGIAADMCDRVIVMQAGRIIERASANQLFKSPLHPYTKALLGCVPLLRKTADGFSSLKPVTRQTGNDRKGCRFLAACKKRFYRCEADTPPPLFRVTEHRAVACWLYEKKGGER
ncbi:MAG: ABC transporter ATP-binding protein [Spirochaetales bacterium]|nr:ABC transporter ATP-binding protein [Spirochaetales bacterium]